MKAALLITPHVGLRSELRLFLRRIQPQPTILEASGAEEALRMLEERTGFDRAILDVECSREALRSVLLLQQRCRNVHAVVLADSAQPGCAGIVAIAGASAGARLDTMLSLLCGDGCSGWSDDHDRLRARLQRAGLTLREQQVLSHAIDGAPYKSIADTLLIAEQTVRHHMSRCLRKLGVKTREQLIALLANER